MPVKSSYEPGTTCWMDLAVPDKQAGMRFYADLFGWEVRETGSGSGYAIARMNGQVVAGFRHAMREGQRPGWMTYFAVADADGTVKRAVDAGATLLQGPEDAHTDGRTADLRDPAGVEFAIWEVRDFAGAQVMDEPGAFSWSECITPDAEKSKGFYELLFGWRGETMQMGEDTYTTFRLGDILAGGMMAADAGDVPRWQTYVAVADCDACVARAVELGATIEVPPTDIPGVGRFAVCTDPSGAGVHLLQQAAPA